MNIEKQTQNTLVIHFISSVEIAANTFGAIEISTLLLLQYYPYTVVVLIHAFVALQFI